MRNFCPNSEEIRPPLDKDFSTIRPSHRRDSILQNKLNISRKFGLPKDANLTLLKFMMISIRPFLALTVSASIWTNDSVLFLHKIRSCAKIRQLGPTIWLLQFLWLGMTIWHRKLVLFKLELCFWTRPPLRNRIISQWISACQQKKLCLNNWLTCPPERIMNSVCWG